MDEADRMSSYNLRITFFSYFNLFYTVACYFIERYVNVFLKLGFILKKEQTIYSTVAPAATR